MAIILKAVSAAMLGKTLAAVRVLNACDDIPYKQVPPYAMKCIQRFLTNHNIEFANSLPVLNYTWSGFAGENAGHTLVVGGAAPPMKVNAGFKRQPPRGTRKMREFLRLQRRGDIIIDRRSVGTVTVRDQPMVVGGTVKQIVEDQIFDPRILAEYVQQKEPCSRRMQAFIPITSFGGYFPGNMYDYGVRGTNSIMGRYALINGAEVSTLLTLYRDDVDLACRAIEAQYLALEPDTALHTSAVSELNEAVYDLSTELAELPETIEMIYSALKKILLYYLETRKKVALLKRKKQTVDDLPAEIAKLWMTYRYGIQPIAYSVQDMLNYLDKSGILYRTVRKASKRQVMPVVEGWEFETPLEVLERSWAKGRFSATITNGLGLNPFVTAWEVIPLSFVIDWVFNVGDFISALTPSMDYDERKFLRSTRCKQTFTGKHLASGLSVPFEIDLYDCEPFNPIDRIGLQFDPFINMKRALDSLSLVWLIFVEDYRKRLRKK